MARYCKIDPSSNVVISVELWDSNPGGAYVASNAAGPGWILDPKTGAFKAPTPPPAPVVPVITYKADLWRRATADEAAIMSADLQDAEAQLRELYMAVQFLDHASPEFPILRSSLAARFGDARADELLAPSVT